VVEKRSRAFKDRQTAFTGKSRVLSLLALLSLTALLSYTHFMATITIRNLDEKVKRDLQVRAALNGRSMEAEVRETLSQSTRKDQAAPRPRLGTALPKRFAHFGGVELQIPPRQSSRSLENDELKQGLGTAIHNLFAPLGGVELQPRHRRNSQRQIPNFE
jgi:plasmid stability protein